MDFSQIDWRSIAGSVAPVAPKIGGVLGAAFPPFGGIIGSIAGNYIASKFNVPPTPEAVGRAIAEDPQAAEKLAQIEQDHGDEIVARAQVEIEKLKQETEQQRIAAESTAGARTFSLGLAKTGSWLSKVQVMLAFTFTLCFFALLVLMLLRSDFKPSDAFLMLLGVLIAGMKDILSFFFGSSAGSQSKDVALKEMAATAVAPPPPPARAKPTGKR